MRKLLNIAGGAAVYLAFFGLLVVTWTAGG